MDVIHQKVLENTVVRIAYNAPAGFVTRAIITRNINYMPDSIGQMVFRSGHFLQAFDLLRGEKITILPEHNILSFVAYNPGKHTPGDLVAPTSLPSKQNIKQYVDDFLKISPNIISRGDVRLLNTEEKKIVLDFFVGCDVENLDEDNVEEAIKDFYFIDSFFTNDGYERAARFLNLESTINQKKFMEQAHRKWMSLIKVYAQLTIGEGVSEDRKKLIESIKYPGVDFFSSEEEIVSYWPMALGVMPNELSVNL